MSLPIKESAEHFDLHSAQGHVICRIPKSIPDLSMTIATMCHSMEAIYLVKEYAKNGHSAGLHEFCKRLIYAIHDVDELYAEAAESN